MQNGEGGFAEGEVWTPSVRRPRSTLLGYFREPERKIDLYPIRRFTQASLNTRIAAGSGHSRD